MPLAHLMRKEQDEARTTTPGMIEAGYDVTHMQRHASIYSSALPFSWQSIVIAPISLHPNIRCRWRCGMGAERVQVVPECTYVICY